MHLNAIKPTITPSVHLMNFQFFTPNGNVFSIPLLEPHKLWDNPKFNCNWNTTLVVTGWNSNVNSTNEAVQTLHNAYKQRNINFVVSNVFRFCFTSSSIQWQAMNSLSSMVYHPTWPICNGIRHRFSLNFSFFVRLIGFRHIEFHRFTVHMECLQYWRCWQNSWWGRYRTQ